MRGFDLEIHKFIRTHSLFSTNSRILIACSGGVDSMALLHFFVRYKEVFKVEVGAVHVDHMLRGAASVADGQLVRAYCEQWSVPFYGGEVPVPDILKQIGGNVQTICREGRYAFFDEIMQKYDYDVLATGHHAEDQLETVLMQITKGIPPLGMPIERKVKEGRLIRPFLPTDKSALYAYANEYAIPFHEDPSNEEDAYMRNRFRHHIVPYIMKENRAVVKSIMPLTDDLQKDEAFLQQLAKEHVESHIKFMQNGYPSMCVKAFCDMPTALQRRAIPLLLNYLYDQENNAIFYKSDLIRQLMEHLQSNEGNISIDLPGGFQFIRSYDRFSFEPKQITQKKRMILPQGEKVWWGSHTWLYWEEIIKVENDIFLDAKEIAFFSMPKASFPLSVRQRETGDRIMLKGMTKGKKVSRLFIDEKVSRTLRDELPVIVTSEEEVCAIPGLRYGGNFTKQQIAESKYIFVVGTH